MRKKSLASQKPRNLRKLQYALIQACCTFKESLNLDLKPQLDLDTKCALNYGPNIGRRVTLSAKLFSSNDMKSACSGMKQKGVNLLKAMLILIMKSATMKTPIVIERIPNNILIGPSGVVNFVSIRMT